MLLYFNFTAKLSVKSCMGPQLYSAWNPGPQFNIKMTSYWYRKSHCADKTILRPSYLHNGISYTGKTTALYWIGALVVITYPCHDIIFNSCCQYIVVYGHHVVTYVWVNIGSDNGLLLTTPKLYLTYCWLIISEVLWHSLEGNFEGITQDIYFWYESEKGDPQKTGRNHCRLLTWRPWQNGCHFADSILIKSVFSLKFHRRLLGNLLV